MFFRIVLINAIHIMFVIYTTQSSCMCGAQRRENRLAIFGRVQNREIQRYVWGKENSAIILVCLLQALYGSPLWAFLQQTPPPEPGARSPEQVHQGSLVCGRRLRRLRPVRLLGTLL